MLTIEPADDDIVGHCNCCGGSTRLIRGFVFEDNDAYAVYLARWTEGHPEGGADMIVSFGNWGKGSKPKSRTAVALAWRSQDGRPGCRVVDGGAKIWPDVKILGKIKGRSDAMASGAATTVFRIADAVLELDPRFRQFMQSAG